MSDSHPLIIPKDKLAGMKSWRPGSLAERPAGAERRAANQPTAAQAAANARADASLATGGHATQAPSSPNIPPEVDTELAVINAAREALVEEATRFDADRANARRAGFAEGFEVGYAEGKSQADVHAKRLDTLATSVQAATAAFEQDVSDQLIALALDVARRVIRTDLATDREMLLPLVQEALRAVPEATAGGELRLHPNDFELVRARLAEELRMGNWLVTPDPAIEVGGCRVVTKQCDVDGTLAARWRRVMQSLGRHDGWTPQ